MRWHMKDTLLFPHSSLFPAHVFAVPKRMYSRQIYRGYQTLVTYPTTFFKAGKISGYLFFLLYLNQDNRRCCHVSSIVCEKSDSREIIEFIFSTMKKADIETIMVENFSPIPKRGTCIFPYSEVLVSLPGTIDLSIELMDHGFSEKMRIPCFEFTFHPHDTPVELHPFTGTEEETDAFWKEWNKRPESLKVKRGPRRKSLDIANYLYHFPLLSDPDLFLFSPGGIVHWVPDLTAYVHQNGVLSSPLSHIKTDRAKFFRVMGKNSYDVMAQSMEYIFSTYNIERFQLDNNDSRILESLLKNDMISPYTLLYERIIFSYEV